VHWSDIPWQPSTRTLRQFGVLFFAFFSALAAAAAAQGRGEIAGCFLGAAMVGGILAFARPSALRFLFVSLIVATFPIGWVVSHLLLALVYFGLFTPLGLVLRWMGRDMLGCKPCTVHASYWEARPPLPAAKRYLDPY
jgi:Saxitoxin biosynthesis operon protein SxtJ